MNDGDLPLSENPQISYEDFKNHKTMNDEAGIISKPASISDAIDELKVSADLKEQFEKAQRLRGRVPNHLLRLIERPGSEQNLAVAFLTHSQNVFSADPYCDDFTIEVNEIIGSESSDTLMWWTFAPYLLQVLREDHAVDELDAFKEILQWARTSEILKNKKRKHQTFSLSGLEPFHEAGIDHYVLSKDPDHITHKFTEQEARRICSKVFGF